jgi:hypothetical protein
MGRHCCWGRLVVLALVGLPGLVAAQPVGSEFKVNAYTTGNQVDSSVAVDANGEFVVVWQSGGQDGSGLGVFGQRYDSAGAALGGEFQVNTYTTSDQRDPSVSSDAGGNFVVAWESSGQDGSSWGVFSQRYDSAGVAQGEEFRVNSYTTSLQNKPSVTSDPSGNFVVVWQSNQGVGGYGVGIFAQRYDSEGVAQGGEFRVNTSANDLPGYPSVAAATDGSFVVAWQASSGFHPITGAVHGRRYDGQGLPQGNQFTVSSGFHYDWIPGVASDAGGNFVVAWPRQYFYTGIVRMFGKRYDSGGDPQGGEFQINSNTPAFLPPPSVAADPQGNFLVAWVRGQDGSGAGVSGQRYDSEGVAQGNEFLINSFTTGGQTGPSVAATDIEGFVASWNSSGQDGSGLGIFGQRFDFTGGPTIHVGDLDRKAKDVGASWRAQVKTLVHDDPHLAESGVLVTFNVSGGVGMRTCTTVASGVCEVSVVVADAVPSLTFSVTNLGKTGFTYTPGANHDPDPDSNGTVIVVNRP